MLKRKVFYAVLSNQPTITKDTLRQELLNNGRIKRDGL